MNKVTLAFYNYKYLQQQKKGLAVRTNPFKTALTVLVYKSGDMFVVTNYRPVRVMAAISKVPKKIICRIVHCFEFHFLYKIYLFFD